MIELEAFRFLRPWGLLLIPPGLVLPLLWHWSRNRRQPWAAVIAPHLLPHLTVGAADDRRLKPVHLTAAMLVLGGVALAGPSWQQDRPEFLENQAPLLVAVDLSPSMATADVSPNRLALAQTKLQALADRNPGTAIGLLAYRGSAHLVLPPARDPQLLALYGEALATDLITPPGRNVADVVRLALSLLPTPQHPATLVLMTDGADGASIGPVQERLHRSRLQVMVLTLGHRIEGASRAGLEHLASELDAELASATANDRDLLWIERHARQHYQQTLDSDSGLRWKDAGYWLVWPLLLLALTSLRRGWRVHWCTLPLLLTLGGYPPPSQAGALLDAFLTGDQQGRLAFEAERYAVAAQQFRDPYLKGLAYYRNGDFAQAIGYLRRVDSADAWFYQGNSHARLLQFRPAIAAYDRALRLRAPFPQAEANRALVRDLARQLDDERRDSPDIGADEFRYDADADGGKATEMPTASELSDHSWLDSLTTSPSEFLRHKFRSQRPPERESLR